MRRRGFSTAVRAGLGAGAGAGASRPRSGSGPRLPPLPAAFVAPGRAVALARPTDPGVLRSIEGARPEPEPEPQRVPLPPPPAEIEDLDPFLVLPPTPWLPPTRGDVGIVVRAGPRRRGGGPVTILLGPDRREPAAAERGDPE